MQIQKKYLLAEKIEKKITNGLGYSPLNHYTDDNKGLIRHLSEMEMTSKVFPIITNSLILAERNNNATDSLLDIMGIIFNYSSSVSRRLFPVRVLEDIRNKLREAGDYLYVPKDI